MQKTPEYAFDIEGHTVVTEEAKQEEFSTREFIEILVTLFSVGLALVLFFAFVFPAIYYFRWSFL
jgi:flagellar biosynthesis/type III secretory pathway M-ring protein FliF/YscJ